MDSIGRDGKVILEKRANYVKKKRDNGKEVK
jgi:hypothetical protein